MLIRNVSIIGNDGLRDILIGDGKIQTVSPHGTEPATRKNCISISFEDAVTFPGLINSHDHLDFNLFPRTGNRIYNNYIEWGRDIHFQNKEDLRMVQQIPLKYRVEWGIYKNLLNGITTVVNHGQFLEITRKIISVYQKAPSLHSPEFEKNWKRKITRPFTGRLPFVIHVGEGTDDVSSREIDEIIRWNIFKKNIIGIHGVAMNKKQAEAFQALVWCPASNLFLLNKTAAVDQLKNSVPIMFGTDSTLTASWNLWDHLRLARNENLTTDKELMDMLTWVPAAVWGVKNGYAIAPGQRADMVVAKRKEGLSGMDIFYALNPEDLLLVIHKGMVRLFDDSLYSQLYVPGFNMKNFSRVSVNGKNKYVEGDLPGLMQEIRKYHPTVQFPIAEQIAKKQAKIQVS